jgi:hypothetical protein
MKKELIFVNLYIVEDIEVMVLRPKAGCPVPGVPGSRSRDLSQVWGSNLIT